MRGFPINQIPILVCQNTGEELGVHKVLRGDEESIVDGVLHTHSGMEYVIKDGILHMLDDATLYSEAKEELLSRDIVAKSYDKKLASRYWKEIPQTLSSLKPDRDQMILDLGCGTGRISGNLTDTHVLGVDISLASLEVFQNKNTELRSLGLVLADATTFRSKQHYFDRVLSSQVYEHIPTRERRLEFLTLVKEALKPGGVFVASVYHHDIRRRLSKLPQEGRHPSGIFYHYFTSKEIYKEFGEIFESLSIRAIDITLPLEARLSLPPKLSGKVSNWMSLIPGLSLFGHLLLISASLRK